MYHFIVIGNPISHSKSPEIHAHFAKIANLPISYQRQYCPNDKDAFFAVVQSFFNGGGVGANVTLPFKQMAFSLCQRQGTLSANAATAKAVNTLALKDGALYGDNTDGVGLCYDLNRLLSQHQLGDLQGKRLLILGAGGAARGAMAPLLSAKVASITIANRTHAKATTLACEFACMGSVNACSLDELTGRFDVVINATSAAVTDTALILPDTLKANLAYDMMYGKRSPFLGHFAQAGAIVADGMGMLIAQAAFSFSLWTGVEVGCLCIDKVTL